MTLDYQSGEKSLLYKRLAEEGCSVRSWVKRQKGYVGGFFSHTVILSETSAPLEIVSRLFVMNFYHPQQSMSILYAAFKPRNF